MYQLIDVLKIVLIVIVGSGRCYTKDNVISQETKEIINEVNDILYSHEELDESIEHNTKDMAYYEDSNGPFSTSNEPPVNNETTTIEVVDCKYLNNMTVEESDESRSTLINFPFSVSIQRKGAHYASGALVGNKWILSSAGEFYNVRESIKLFRARLGSVDCKRGGTLMPLKGITIHPAYMYKKPNFDIALLRMATPVPYSDIIRPISMSNLNGKVVSAKFMTTYWPRLVVNKVVLPETAKERIKYNSMRVSTQKMIPANKCELMMKSTREVLDSSSLCLKPVVTHHSICMPDAGAPVVAEDGLWGITSGWISSKCTQSPGPTLFTRVSSYIVRSWLDTQLLDL